VSDHEAARIGEDAERRWARIVFATIGVLILVMILVSWHWAAMPPSRVETVDIATVQTKGEFVEDNLGTTMASDGKITVRLIAQQYSFSPQCLAVPAGMPVTFRATSTDAIHGFVIAGTNANTMIVPGFVSTFTTTFSKPGEAVMPCHEYCGIGHEAMWARVQVLKAEEFLEKARNGERVGCVHR
jgi:cytochrome c oxidase subunit 2